MDGCRQPPWIMEIMEIVQMVNGSVAMGLHASLTNRNVTVNRIARLERFQMAERTRKDVMTVAMAVVVAAEKLQNVLLLLLLLLMPPLLQQ